MPTEMRKIVFTAEELQAALVNYALRTNKKLPNATIDNILVEGKEGVTATIVYMRDGTDEAKSVEFTSNDVAAAIILYCSGLIIIGQANKNTLGYLKTHHGADGSIPTV